MKFDISEYQVSILFSIFYVIFLYDLNLFDNLWTKYSVCLIFGCEL